jgi:hypothetical protein
MCEVGGHHSICHTLSLYKTSKTSTFTLVISTTLYWSMLQERHSICTCNFLVWALTRGWEKLTWLCLCESLFYFKTKSNFCSQKPTISSPSMCVILIVKDEPNAYFRIAYAWYFKSNQVVLCRRNSFLLSIWPKGPPFLK